MKLFIKNMVSRRCKMLVDAELKKLRIPHHIVELGEVEVVGQLPKVKQDKLKTALRKARLELMDDKQAILVERIKNVIVEMVHHTGRMPRTNFSDYLSRKLKQDYTTLATLFSQEKGMTIEQFIIIHKIERAKELIMYDELNLTEIAYKMQYSSVAHLSNQFKKITGMTPTYYKSLRRKKRNMLEDL